MGPPSQSLSYCCLTSHPNAKRARGASIILTDPMRKKSTIAVSGRERNVKEREATFANRPNGQVVQQLVGPWLDPASMDSEESGRTHAQLE